MSNIVKVGFHTIELSSLDKVFFPDEGITKGDLVDYYRRIADTMLPHLEEHPLNMQRFPDGLDGFNFYQKEVPDYFPDWIGRVSIEVKEEQSKQEQVVCNNPATLVYLANQACLTPHLWLSRVDRLEHPDKLIFDLDPPADDFEPVHFAARALRDMLRELELVAFVMTTGSQGLHVAVPLDRQADFDTTRNFARALAEHLAQRNPKRLTTEVRKNKRKGRVFLDYLRNAYGQTGVSPYAARAKAGAPVAAPLEWEELGDSNLHAQSYTIGNIFRRLGQKSDPWAGMRQHAQNLEAPKQQLEVLGEF
ncbi:MAG: non-homologous end-joining DNA ligase [Anaerolineae bacterium]|nr:non-homologous end-joining DNA ligase [Anaerolineae bacterium]